ncbi:MAG TPA: type II toxin-antitoxin system VapC family toxin [Candidatus Acidoferrales bacterium]|nr:type II toxin-antitoxin system VapC family toxin [Candidatus Acidoferrales bacterium]
MTSCSFLIDTDWIIDHFNGVERVTRRLLELRGQGLAVSVVSVAELWEGVYSSRDPGRSQAMLEEFLSGVAILGIDPETCQRFGQLRGTLRGRGEKIADFDLLIASSALRHGLTLLSNNRKHFEGIEGLAVESKLP